MFPFFPSSIKIYDCGEHPVRMKNTKKNTFSNFRPLKNDENSINANVRHKIVVMGAAKVGKSSLITQFLYSTFSPKYKRTVEEMHHGHFSVGGVNLTLDILDTSGSYEVSLKSIFIIHFSGLNFLYFRNKKMYLRKFLFF